VYFGLIQIILNPTSNGIFFPLFILSPPTLFFFFPNGGCVHNWWSCLCMLTSNRNTNRKWVPQGATIWKTNHCWKHQIPWTPNQAPQNAYSSWVHYYKLKMNPTSMQKSNMGAKCVWASSIVFEEKMGQASATNKGKKKQLVLLYCLSSIYVHI